MDKTLDTIHATVDQEVSARAERLARMQTLQTRIQRVKELQATLDAEVVAIKSAFDAEMGPARAADY